MKFNFDIKNKKAGFEADVERIVEKGMDQHEKDWFEKFNLKQKTKKEMKELEHKQKIEMEEVKQRKLNWYQRKQEEKRKNKELEQKLEQKHFMQGMAIMIGLMIFFFIIAIIGSIFET